MTDDRELSALMRDGMTAEVRQITADSAFTERMILVATAGSPDRVEEPRNRGWQAWVLPLAAAVLVALLVSSALIGGKLLHSSPTRPISSTGPLPQTSAPAPSHRPSTSPTPSATPSSSTGGNPQLGPVGGPVPPGFRAVDLTWISAEQGWALGTAPCTTAPCTSIVRTADGGKSWVGIHAPVAEFFGSNSCKVNCLTSLRFASPLIGYAFGPGALYLTTDGGDHWLRQAGNAYALEIADGNVLRVTDKSSNPGTNCGIYAGCAFKVQRADVGSTSWRDVSLPAGGPSLVGLSLVRSGPLAVLTTFGHVAGGGQSAQSALFVTSDDGDHWKLVTDPCAVPSGPEFDTRATSTAEDGSLSVLCVGRQGGSGGYVRTSTDAGAHFSTGQGALAPYANLIGAASSRTLVAAAQGGFYRSTDGGAHWSQLTDGPTSASYIGFESGTVGRVVESPHASGVLGSPVIWTTTDAGATWTSYTFK